MKNLLQKGIWTSVIALVCLQQLHAQSFYNQTERYLKGNGIWAVNDSMLLNFNDPVNFVDESVLTFSASGSGIEGSATVSDPITGELLFYTNGQKVWNADHEEMPNGTDLSGNGISDFTTMQGVCVVPFVSDNSKYYVFSLSSQASIMGPRVANKLYYSVVDMNQGGGLGDVEASTKNTLLDSASLSEAMIAVPGNSCDIWLLTHTSKDPVFKAYNITAQGVDPTPIVSTVGNQISGKVYTTLMNAFPIEDEAYSQSIIKVSPQRDKLAIISMNIMANMGINHLLPGGYIDLDSTTGRTMGTLLLDFDATTGIVDNGLLIDTLPPVGVEFSPDGSRLYLLSCITEPTQPTSLYQFDLSSGSSTSIIASKTLVQAFPAPTSVTDPLFTGSLKLYNDTIYANLHGSALLYRINAPNATGVACDFDSIIHNNNQAWFEKTSMDLPNAVVFLPQDTSYNLKLDTFICRGWNNGIKLSPGIISDAYQYDWNMNSTDPVLEISEAGTYWVTYTDACFSFHVDTFKVQGAELPEPVIRVYEMELSTALSYDSYQWLFNGAPLPGEIDSILHVEVNGDYQVIVTNEEGCVDTSEIYTVTNAGNSNISRHLAHQIQVWPNPVKDEVFVKAPVPVNLSITTISGQIIQARSRSTPSLSMQDLAAGMYLLRITDQYGNLLKVEKLIKAEQ